MHLLSHFNVLSAACSEILLQRGLVKKHISNGHPLGVMPEVSFCNVFTWLCKYPVPKSNPWLIIKLTDTVSTLKFTDKRLEQSDAVEKQKPGTRYASTSCFGAACCHTVSFTQQLLGGGIINTICQKDPMLLLSLKELFRDPLCFRSPSQNLQRPFRQNDIH